VGSPYDLEQGSRPDVRGEVLGPGPFGAIATHQRHAAHEVSVPNTRSSPFAAQWPDPSRAFSSREARLDALADELDRVGAQ